MQRNPLRVLWRDENGTVAVTFALLATVLFGAIALAVDMARSFNVSNKLTNALDAAAMAGAKALDRGDQDAEVEATAKAYFDTQWASLRVHGVTATLPTVTVNRNKSSVTIAVDTSMATTFGGIIGQSAIPLSKSSSVVYKARNVELAMALDITGSMSDGTKLADMRTASKEILDTLFTDAKSEEAVRIALVPWSSAVNAGTLASSVSGGASTDNCVVERANGQASDDYPSGGSAFRAVTTSPYGYYSCPTDPVMPLSGKSKSNDIKSVIDGFTPVGGTAGHLGMSWAWNLLSPSWASLVPPESAPGAYSPNETVKAAVLLSDGEFNLSYLNGPSLDLTTMRNESYQHFQALCSSMKAKKVQIFMVGFGTPDAMAQQQMKDCATSPDHVFQAATGSQLKDAFSKIASQLKRMRLTQ